MSINIGFAGTYTREKSDGIYQFELDTNQQVLKKKRLASEVGNPTYLTITDSGYYLYSVAQEDGLGGIHAYKINCNNLDLIKTSSQLMEGKPPCHLSINGNKLITSNYHKGTVEIYNTSDQGGLDLQYTITHEGSGPHQRQEKSHIHYAGFSPDGKYVFACDLGADKVITYMINRTKIHHVQTLKLEGGSGPRHIVFHPDGKHAFLVTELSSEVILLEYDINTGSLTEKQHIKTIPNDFTGVNDASAIHISSDGRFVYTGNRGHNSITVFQVDEKTMELSLVERVSSGGEWPRDFVLDPSESYLVASNQHTGNIVLFVRNKKTGMLTKTNSEINVPEVVCVKFIPH